MKDFLVSFFLGFFQKYFEPKINDRIVDCAVDFVIIKFEFQKTVKIFYFLPTLTVFLKICLLFMSSMI